MTNSNVSVKQVDQLDGGWLATVSVGERSYQVGVSKEYYKKLSKNQESVEQLLIRSFEFLLERESAESIMARFELSVISRYFPEYETVMTSGKS